MAENGEVCHNTGVSAQACAAGRSRAKAIMPHTDGSWGLAYKSQLTQAQSLATPPTATGFTRGPLRARRCVLQVPHLLGPARGLSVRLYL